MVKLIKKYIKTKNASCAAVVVAAGSSNRMQGTDKILYLLDGEPLIVHTVRAFQENPLIKEIVIVTRQELIEELSGVFVAKGFSKVSAITSGGGSRAESVMNGLDHVSKNIGYAAIHDGARPFVTQKIITDTVAKAVEYHAAAPAVPVKDTIKIAHGHVVTHTPDRATLFAVQTPQVFDFDLLRGALKKALDEKLSITDDCSAVEALGMSVYLTQGSDENIKVTTPTDLILAQAIKKERDEQ